MTAILHNDTSTPTPPTETLPQQETILLVEDDASMRRYLEVTLERAGYRVVAVGDGLQAMRRFLNERFDAVVTDAMLPYVSGREICRFLRGHPSLAATPVVLLSGFSAATPEVAAAEADVYLGKPVRPDELIACVQQLLAKTV